MRFATLVMCVILTLLSACATKPPEKSRKGLTEQEVYESAQKHLNNGSWLAAIQTLQMLEENFPFGTYGEQAQLELIYAHYQADNFEDVIANAERFIRLHPQHRDVDYAYYMRGLASYNRESGFVGSIFGADNTDRDIGGAREAFDHFALFIQRFPNSPYASDAQKRMVYLRNVMARSEIHVANYYFKRGAYLAAAKRGSFVVENFQRTPAVPDGLAVMAQAYYLLDMKDMADTAVKVLAANFPDYPALKDNGEFDQTYYLKRHRRGWFSYVTFGLFERAELAGFDTRAQYSPEYQDETEFEKIEAPRPDKAG
ncbi:outer membrane protein assembly factor BamD [Saccharophagus sp. K07]|uniref:outer membrane protein assembly factor BamD n=1 Tax=Saccharophagus sp. K07 TaxID=2283636 RepID=UPI0016525D70|nr:outer membrane protein assembly factor BamD [Saccharophagus sp. K07]MBC6904645.1 outer membrane protein assembly factor BamD [Saccharophagus sp. K07]